jgi:hypothetical protein
MLPLNLRPAKESRMSVLQRVLDWFRRKPSSPAPRKRKRKNNNDDDSIYPMF